MKVFSFAKSNQGNALIEFLIVLPVIILFLVGIFETGRLLTQVSMVANSSYEAVMVGSEIRGEGTELAMDDRAFFLYDLQNEQYLNPTITSSFDSDNDTVTVEISTDLRPLLNFIPLHVKTVTTGPMLVLDSNINEDYNAFANPPPCGYICAAPPPAPGNSCNNLFSQQMCIPGDVDFGNKGKYNISPYDGGVVIKKIEPIHEVEPKT